MEEITTFTRFLDILQGQPVLTLFLIIGMRYLIGGIRIGSFSLGPVAGVERDREDMVSHLDYKYHGVKLYGILHF